MLRRKSHISRQAGIEIISERNEDVVVTLEKSEVFLNFSRDCEELAGRNVCRQLTFDFRPVAGLNDSVAVLDLLDASRDADNLPHLLGQVKGRQRLAVNGGHCVELEAEEPERFQEEVQEQDGAGAKHRFFTTASRETSNNTRKPSTGLEQETKE